MKRSIVSHVQLVDANGETMHEVLSRHVRGLVRGERVVLTPGGDVVRMWSRARGRVFEVDSAELHELPLTLVETVLARECQSDALASHPMQEVTSTSQ